MDLCWQSNMLSTFAGFFLPRSKYLLISWLQSLSTVILEPRKIKSVTVFIFSPSICHELMGPDAMILVVWMLSFRQTFSLFSFTFIKRLFYLLFTFCCKGGVICISEVTDISPSNLDSSLCFFQPSISLHRSSISRVTIYSLDMLLYLFGTSLLFHVQF